MNAAGSTLYVSICKIERVITQCARYQVQMCFFWSANKQRYDTVQQLIAQLSSVRAVRLLTVKWWKTHSFLYLFVQLSYNKQFITQVVI